MLTSLFRALSRRRSPVNAVLVLGMHRSGTSSLAGSLQERGLRLGKVFTSNPHNRKGNRENAAVMALNDQVLAASGGAWDRPPPRITWDRGMARQRDQLIASLTCPRGTPWGFKDPRTLLTLPFWEQGLADRRLVGTFRHPHAVARSLHARQGMPLEQGVALWCGYNLRLLDLLSRQPFPLVSFDVPPDEYLRTVDRIATELGLGAAAAGGSFFEASLRHQDPAAAAGPQPPDDGLDLYERLQAFYRAQAPAA